VDCATSSNSSNNVALTYSANYSGQPTALVYNPSGYVAVSSVPLSLNTWTHVAVTLTGSLLNMYLKGKSVYTNSSFGSPNNVSRTSCFIGKRNWPSLDSANAYFDDIMIYTRGLSASEIATVMNLYIPNQYLRVAYSIINQWTFEQSLYDPVSATSLTTPTSVSFVADRFGIVNSAAYFNSGYATLPAAVYFSGDYSITVWVSIQSLVSGAPRLVDLGTL
jgi:hypothetical protein